MSSCRSQIVVIILAFVCGINSNPYIDKDVYVINEYINNVSMSINLHPTKRQQLQKYQYIPVFYWVDSISKISNLSNILQSAMKQQTANNSKVLVQIVIHDVPDRDCATIGHGGEINCEDSECTQGIQTYQKQFIDPIVSLLQKYPDLTIVAVIEPDSLPNLATNLNVPKCQQAETAYMTCIPYAIKQLNTLPNVYQYVDAAQGGWLGYPANMQKFTQVVKAVLNSAGGMNTIHGFATNIGMYQPIGSLTSQDDPCELKENYNMCINEAIYINYLNQQMETVGVVNKTYITDTGRNGKTPCMDMPPPDCGSPCCDTCNVKGCIFGEIPTTNTSSTGIGDLIDAFAWIHVPQLSDGTSNKSASDFSMYCASDGSLQPSPEYDYWFDEYFVMLSTTPAPTVYIGDEGNMEID